MKKSNQDHEEFLEYSLSIPISHRNAADEGMSGDRY